MFNSLQVVDSLWFTQPLPTRHIGMVLAHDVKSGVDKAYIGSLDSYTTEGQDADTILRIGSPIDPMLIKIFADRLQRQEKVS